MPRIPDHPCSHPMCKRCVPRGQKYCDEHAPMHPEEKRSAAGRGYNAAWRAARKRYLADPGHIFCVECLREGKYVKATDVDHIVPHRGDMKLFWDESNWQPLCHSHHSIKTRNEDHNPVYTY